MALSASIQNLMTMANPEYGSSRGTPQQYAGALYGASAGIGDNERAMKSLNEQLEMLKLKRQDLLNSEQYTREASAFDAGYGTNNERADWLRENTGFTINNPASIGAIGKGFGTTPSTFVNSNTQATPKQYYTARPYQIGRPYQSSYERLAEFKKIQDLMKPVSGRA